MAEASKPTKAVEVFFSYSHKDEDLRGELSNHLSLLTSQKVITAWHDRRIGAGKEWENEIDEHLNAADIILLLVSSDFLASAYCYDVEVKRAMERHEASEARVIPVILRPVDWKGAPFGKLQALPKDARPVTDWPNRDQAFLDVAQGIRVAAEELVIRQINRLLASPAKVESLRKHWPNVISLGERILKWLPDHLPEYQTVRSKTATAYVKRWTRCFDERLQDVIGHISIKTKRHEDPVQVINQIIADLNRAIQLEPENAEYYYLRFSMRRDLLVKGVGVLSFDDRERFQEGSLADLERAIQLDPSTAQYYLARSKVHTYDDDEEGALRDHKRALDLGYEEGLGFKERWRLKCLRD